MAAPIPFDAPVTIATLPLSVLIVGSLSHSSAIELPEKLSLSYFGLVRLAQRFQRLARYRASARRWQTPDSRLERGVLPDPARGGEACRRLSASCWACTIRSRSSVTRPERHDEWARRGARRTA